MSTMLNFGTSLVVFAQVHVRSWGVPSRHHVRRDVPHASVREVSPCKPSLVGWCWCWCCCCCALLLLLLRCCWPIAFSERVHLFFSGLDFTEAVKRGGDLAIFSSDSGLLKNADRGIWLWRFSALSPFLAGVSESTPAATDIRVLSLHAQSTTEWNFLQMLMFNRDIFRQHPHKRTRERPESTNLRATDLLGRPPTHIR